MNAQANKSPQSKLILFKRHLNGLRHLWYNETKIMLVDAHVELFCRKCGLLTNQKPQRQ